MDRLVSMCFVAPVYVNRRGPREWATLRRLLGCGVGQATLPWNKYRTPHG